MALLLSYYYSYIHNIMAMAAGCTFCHCVHTVENLEIFVLTNRKNNEVDGIRTCNLRTAMQTSYPMSHYGSH